MFCVSSEMMHTGKLWRRSSKALISRERIVLPEHGKPEIVTSAMLREGGRSEDSVEVDAKET